LWLWLLLLFTLEGVCLACLVAAGGFGPRGLCLPACLAWDFGFWGPGVGHSVVTLCVFGLGSGILAFIGFVSFS